jgi:large subunit ribosomal protein L10
MELTVRRAFGPALGLPWPCHSHAPLTDKRRCRRVRPLAPVHPVPPRFTETGLVYVENGMDRAQKAELVAELNQTFAEVGVVVVTRNLGMTVAQSTALRNKMREAGASYKVSKNKLAKIALGGTDYLSLGDMLTGPVGLATSVDPVAAAKVAVDFAKTTDKFVIVGGAMGATVLNEDGVKALATMPSLDELRAKIVGLLQAPAAKLASITQAPAAQLARVFNAYAEKDKEAA